MCYEEGHWGNQCPWYYQNGELKAQGDEPTIAPKEEPPKAQSDEPSLAPREEPAARSRSTAGVPSDEGGGPNETEREPSL